MYSYIGKVIYFLIFLLTIPLGLWAQPDSVPKIEVIPLESTPDLVNNLNFYGPRLGYGAAYYAYKDHKYNKIYVIGRHIQIIDFDSLTNGLPTSHIYSDLWYTQISRLETAISSKTDKIYIATVRNGIYEIDRKTGSRRKIDPLKNTDAEYKYPVIGDLVVDDSRDLLYASVFRWRRGTENYNHPFFGILKLNLVTGKEEWITSASNPIDIPNVADHNHEKYWGGHRLYLDDKSNTLYYSCGFGLWWCDFNRNHSGYLTTKGGFELNDNIKLPSDSTTHILINQESNEFYIGTHKGLLIWDKTNHSSKLYDQNNSLMDDDLVNSISINSNDKILYVALEYGGLWELDLKTRIEHNYDTIGNVNYNSILLDKSVSSAYYDSIDNKLYISVWENNNYPGVIIKDYNNLVDIRELNNLNKWSHYLKLITLVTLTIATILIAIIGGLRLYRSFPK